MKVLRVLGPCLAILALIFVARLIRPQEARTVAELATSGEKEARASGLDEPGDPRERSLASTTDWQSAQLLVLTARGDPIRAAYVVNADERRRELLQNDTAILSRSDDSGRAPLSRTWLTSHPSSMLAVSAEGFLCSQLPVSALEDGAETVTLLNGVEHSFQCRDVNGNPVAGILIVCSRGPIQILGSTPNENPLPGVHPEASRSYSVTDATGLARIRGLSEGRYTYRIWSTEYVLVSAVPHFSHFDTTTPDSTIILSPLLGIAYHCTADAILGSSVRYSSWPTTGLAEAALSAGRTKLAKAFPDCEVAVIASLTPQPDPVTIKALLDGRGLVSVDVIPLPLSSVAPVDLSLAPRISNIERADCQIAFALPTPGDNCFAREIYVVIDDKSPVAGINVPVKEGVLKIPPGSYKLNSFSPWLAHALEKQKIVSPGENVLRFEETFRQCCLLCSADNRLDGEHFEIEIAREGESYRFTSLGSNTISVMMPLGRFTARLLIKGLWKPTVFEVKPSESCDPQTIAVFFEEGV